MKRIALAVMGFVMFAGAAAEAHGGWGRPGHHHGARNGYCSPYEFSRGLCTDRGGRRDDRHDRRHDRHDRRDDRRGHRHGGWR